ncbi:NAD-dependent epimerase/dehydratase family protein [Thalassovita taeanensis]|uniref:NAD-dependent epimerase/dehydratase family protein n=1 Tax=Thalassovita taeanensis TaxID=657014 RepID=UPI0015878AF1|nr:NAD-dependent epimerase/dehydratase family protein [Thalassovita taeanensis]
MNRDNVKTVLVLGASGKVGRLLRAVWSAQPPQGLRPLYQFRSGPAAPDTAIWAPGDPVQRLGSVDRVIALWGVTSGDADALAQNTRLAITAMQIAQQTGADRVLHCSSVAVYAPADHPLTETDRIAPTNPYGQAKADMERAVLAHAPTGAHPCCLRIGSVAGAESLAASVAAHRTGTSTTPLTLDQFANGHGPERSYIAPSDLAQALAALCRIPLQSLPKALNLAAPQPVTMNQLLTAAQIPFAWRPAPTSARQSAVLDTTRLSTLVPFDQNAGDPDRIVQDWLQWDAAT